jgi:ribonuclease T2
MNKLIIAFILFSVSLFAREELFPTQECPAFNNIKHTKNTHSVHLDTQQKYTILQHHKGQNLILIKGEQPAQRWVDDECFSIRPESSNPLNVKKVERRVVSIDEELSKIDIKTDLPKHTKKYKNNYTNKYETENISKQNLLTLSWHNAFCETHRVKKECKRSMFSFARPNYSEKHFVLHGLWPQPKSKIYCGVDGHTVTMDKHKQWNRLPDLGLSDKVKKRLQKVMPGFSSNLHKHEWIKHGTCYGTDANRYYEDSINMVEQVNDSKVGDFFKKHIGKRVTLQQVRAVFDRSFGLGTGKRIELKCNKGLITELWLHLGSGSDDLGRLLKQGKQTRSHCQSGFIDKAGF